MSITLKTIVSSLVVSGVAVTVVPCAEASTLPPVLPGQQWVLNTTDTHVSSASGGAMFNVTHNIGSISSPTTSILNDTLSLQTFDATGNATTHYCILTSDVVARLTGSGAGVVANLTNGAELAPSQGFDGSIYLSNWQISGAATSGVNSDSLSRGVNERLSLGPVAVATYTDFATGNANALLDFSTTDINAVHDGSQIDIDFNGLYVLDITSPVGPQAGVQQTLGTGTAAFNASLVTVYQEWILISEPSGMALCGLPVLMLLGTRRRRRAK